jgi:hypothetical protein
MNSKQKYVIVVALLLISAILIWWLISGGEVLSKDGIWVDQEISELDKALGLEPQKVYVEKFIPGLLPHTAVLSGIIVVISTILFFIFRTKK